MLKHKQIFIAAILVLSLYLVAYVIRVYKTNEECLEIENYKQKVILNDLESAKSIFGDQNLKNIYHPQEYLTDENIFRNSRFSKDKEFGHPEVIRNFLLSTKNYNLFELYRLNNNYFLFFINKDKDFIFGSLPKLIQQIKLPNFVTKKCINKQYIYLDHAVLFVVLVIMFAIATYLLVERNKEKTALETQKRVSYKHLSKLLAAYEEHMHLLLKMNAEEIDYRYLVDELQKRLRKYFSCLEIDFKINNQVGSKKISSHYINIIYYLVIRRISSLNLPGAKVNIEIAEDRIEIKDNGYNHNSTQDIEPISNIIDFIENEESEIQFLGKSFTGLVQIISFKKEQGRGDDNVFSLNK
ncbi:MAG: hypothetical protein RLN62_02765 [Rickettsiales bacterium]